MSVNQTQKVITRFPIESDLEAQNINRITDLINEVFDHAESGMWKSKCIRTNPTEVEHLLRTEGLILAEIDGVLVGSVGIHIFSDGVAEFGMLAADRKYRGLKIGSALVEHAETWHAKMDVTRCVLKYSPRAIGHIRAKNFCGSGTPGLDTFSKQLNLSNQCLRRWLLD